MFSQLMGNTWLAATVVAVVAALAGFFTVQRGSAFVAHALPNGAFAGAAGATLVGVNTLVGLGVFSVAGAMAIAGLGRRARHDVATALTIVAMLATGGLFVQLKGEYAPQLDALLFGQLFGVSNGQIEASAVMAAACCLALAALYRPLLLSSTVPDVAAARGVRPAATEMAFLLVIALVTTVSVPVVGALLIFSLLIAPAAAARQLTDRPGRAIALGVALALITVWSAIAISYETNWPIGFLVGAGGALSYGVARVVGSAGS